jgi:transposase
MAAPLPKEDKVKILDYLRQRDLSDLTGVKIKDLIKEDLGIDISQPTASKLKGEILEDNSDDWGFSGDDSSLSEETGTIAEPTNPDKIRQLSQEQMNAIEHLLKGQSDRAVAEAVGVSLQTVWDWRNNDPLFIAELNRQRVELWREARERLKSLANRALDVVEEQLNSGDPKASLAAAKYILQGTRLLGETDLLIKGPTTPEGVLLPDLRSKAGKN